MSEKNAIAIRDHKPALDAGAPVAAIVPRSIEETFRLAGAIHASGMAPSSLRNADQVMVAIMAGAELGLAPFQALQSIAVINNRPTLWGDGLMAVVRANGFRVREWLEGEGDGMIARCEVTRPDTEEVAAAAFSVADAKKAGLWGKQGPWQGYPKRMLQMRARAYALRDGAADVLRGFQIREEVEDYTRIAPEAPAPSGIKARLEQHGDASAPGYHADNTRALDAVADPVPEFDRETGEIIDAEVSEPEPPAAESPAEDNSVGGGEDDVFPGDKPAFDVLQWASDLNRRLPEYADVDVLRADWCEHKAELQEKSPGLFKETNKAVAGRAAAIAAKAVAE